MPREKVELLTDASQVPTRKDEIGLEFISSYCEKSPKLAQWYVETATKTVKDENGEEKPITWQGIRREFVAKFFPELLETNSEKKKYTKQEEILRKMKSIASGK